MMTSTSKPLLTLLLCSVTITGCFEIPSDSSGISLNPSNKDPMLTTQIIPTVSLDAALLSESDDAETDRLIPVGAKPTPNAGFEQAKKRLVKLMAFASDNPYGTQGSGVILNKQGDILTAYHVYRAMIDQLKKTKYWNIEQPDGTEIEVPFRCDIAIIEHDICVIQNTSFHESSTVKTGKPSSKTTLMGYMEDTEFFEKTISYGERKKARVFVDIQFWWELDPESPIYLEKYEGEEREWSGSSGGGAYDRSGRLVGMVVAARDSDLYLVPASDIVKSLKTYGYQGFSRKK